MKPSLPLLALLVLGLTHTAKAQDTAPSTPLDALQASDHPLPPLGRWITESGNLEVLIAPCDSTRATTLCGKVVRVLGNRSMSARGTDMAAVDTRPTLGMTLLSDLRETNVGDGSHDVRVEYKGAIYNRENAKTYRATITSAQPDQLLVHAYVGLPLFGKTQVWHRPSTEQEDVQ